MNILNKYLVVIYICLAITYSVDIIEQRGNMQTMIPQLMMLAFVNISVITAFFSRKWFGQLLLYANFLLVGLVPLILGIISCWVSDHRVKKLFKVASAGIPIVLLIFTLVALWQGKIVSDSVNSFRFLVYRLIQAAYWYTVYMYSSIHLKEELDKIEQQKA